MSDDEVRLTHYVDQLESSLVEVYGDKEAISLTTQAVKAGFNVDELISIVNTDSAIFIQQLLLYALGRIQEIHQRRKKESQ